MKTAIRAGKTVNIKELAVIANFTNGFAENVLELSDGTLIFISFNGDRVKIIERQLITDPQEITNIINATTEDEE